MSDQVLVSCAACGARNRVTTQKLREGATPTCGECGAALPGSETQPIVVTDATFAAQVTSSPTPVLVDLWAPWCAPCRMLTPTLEAIAQEMAGKVRIAKVNVDENPATADRLGVHGIPTMVLFRNGQEIDRMVGALPKHAILQRLGAL